MENFMKKHSAVSLIFTIIFAASSVSLCGCSEEKKYSLSVSGSELLYEDLNDSYKAGEEVKVKVKITPYLNTVAYLDLVPLVRAKSSDDDFYTFTFTMPDKSSVLQIENVRGFSEDLLTGFYLTFFLDGSPIENLSEELESAEAVADYYYFDFDEIYGSVLFTSNEGADVFADGKTREWIDEIGGLKEFELDRTLYYTYELSDATVGVNWVYCNQETREIRTSIDATFGLEGTDSVFSVCNTQSLSDTRFSVAGDEYEATFESEIRVNFKYIDYLTGVRVLEYDTNDQLLKSGVFSGTNRSEHFIVSDMCEYAVIEEEYTIMIGENKFERYRERTVVDKTATVKGRVLKYARGDGLISPVYLTLDWPA